MALGILLADMHSSHDKPKGLTCAAEMEERSPAKKCSPSGRRSGCEQGSQGTEEVELASIEGRPEAWYQVANQAASENI